MVDTLARNWHSGTIDVIKGKYFDKHKKFISLDPKFSFLFPFLRICDHANYYKLINIRLWYQSNNEKHNFLNRLCAYQKLITINSIPRLFTFDKLG